MMQIQDSRTDSLDELILRNSPSPATASLIVSEWYNQGRYDAVIKACGEMLSLYPEDMRLRRLACLAYSALGLDREAIEEVEEIVRRIDHLADIFILRARIFHRLKMNRETLEALALYLAHRPGDAGGLAFLEELRQEAVTGRRDIPPTEEATGGMPPVASATIAELYLSQGLVEEAVHTYRLVVAGNPHDDESRRRLEELEPETRSVASGTKTPTGFSAGAGYRTVIEQWRAKCRALFGPTVPPDKQGGNP